MRIFIPLLFWLYSASLSAEGVVRTIPPQSEDDVSHSYFIALLNGALSNTEDLYGEVKVQYSTQMEQGRAVTELAHGRTLDVYWAGTSITRENRLRAVRVPLLKGLLGFRVSLIRRDRRADFDRVENLQQLQRFSACQGKHWPDSDVLEAAGIPVQRGAIYELMFRQVNAGRCDFFPRGVHEGVAEMAARQEKYPQMMLYPELIIYYPFPMYFFVAPDNQELAQRLELGLNRMIDNGEFARHLREHQATAHLFPLDKWIQKRVIRLANPLLPMDTPVTDERYWIQPYSLSR